jgi:hypothetical protein
MNVLPPVNFSLCTLLIGTFQFRQEAAVHFFSSVAVGQNLLETMDDRKNTKRFQISNR